MSKRELRSLRNKDAVVVVDSITVCIDAFSPFGTAQKLKDTFKEKEDSLKMEFIKAGVPHEIDVLSFCRELPRHALDCLLAENAHQWRKYFVKVVSVLQVFCATAVEDKAIQNSLLSLEDPTEGLQAVLDATLFMMVVAICPVDCSPAVCDGDDHAHGVDKPLLVQAFGVMEVLLASTATYGATFQRLLNHPQKNVLLEVMSDGVQLFVADRQLHRDEDARHLISLLETFFIVISNQRFAETLLASRFFRSGLFLRVFSLILEDRDPTCVFQALRILGVLADSDDLCFLDLLAHPTLEPFAHHLLRLICRLGHEVIVSRSFDCVHSVESLKLLEIISGDSNFMKFVTTHARSLTRPFAHSVIPLSRSCTHSLPRAVAPSIAHLFSSPEVLARMITQAVSAVQIEALVCLYKIIGSLACFNPQVSKPEDEGIFLRTFQESIHTQGVSSDRVTASVMALRAIPLCPRLTEPFNEEDRNLVTRFCDQVDHWVNPVV